MTRFFSTLYGRLSAYLLVLVVALGAVLLVIAHYTSDMYAKEVTQRLNHDIAMYVTAERQLIENDVVNQDSLKLLAHQMMVINPSVEVYLLDRQGNILSYALPPEAVVRQSVSLLPIQKFINAQQRLPIMGDDPRNSERQKIFSVSPVEDGGEVVGYLYAILGGVNHETIQKSVQESYILKVGLATIAGSVIIVALAGSVLFFFLTRRLYRLTRSVEAFQASDYKNGITLDGSIDSAESQSPRDEVDQLSVAVRKMSEHISHQFEALKSLDVTRRELVANVSHDLRTPLAAMQGYIETLIIKDESLTLQERKEYLQTAHKHSQRLASLVSELFELAKLDSGSIQPAIEPFSLMELVHDSVQDYQLRASDKNISLQIQCKLDDCIVYADIALIQRVLQNLLDNALRYTPVDGVIAVEVIEEQGRATVTVSDNGEGIQTHEISHIFERYYRSQKKQPSADIGTGLGLAIVKRILDLHQSTISVSSELNKGTRFIFDLPSQNHYSPVGATA
jgi:two-component system, OmpR family, sensor kinase